MVSIHDLTGYLNNLLVPQQFQDYCPNGLQVSGCMNVDRLVTGVSANQALIDQAIAAKANALLVHHGFFWKGEDPCIVGIKQQRIKKLLQHDINLLAYHLPLDAHPEFGNNAQLAAALDINNIVRFDVNGAPGLGNYGELNAPILPQAFVKKLTTVLSRKPLHIAPNDKPIKTLAWCTGAAPDMIMEAIVLGVDAYITGEIAERTVAIAQEANIHFFAAGHHATERFGVRMLGEHLAAQFQLTHQFIDIDNPV